jgi:hypothetical protein
MPSEPNQFVDAPFPADKGLGMEHQQKGLRNAKISQRYGCVLFDPEWDAVITAFSAIIWFSLDAPKSL